MRTLLPKKELRHLKHEYRLRCLILLLFFLAGAVWVGIISLFPSYVLSVAEQHNAAAEAGKIDSSRQANGAGQTIAQVKDADSLIDTVASSQDTLFFSSLIEDIDSRRLPDMIITGFNLSHTSTNSGTQSSIVVNGNAATRDILVAFEQNLEADPRLTQVELPVSDLAADTNINFSITMQGIQ